MGFGITNYLPSLLILILVSISIFGSAGLITGETF
jgi:hypothetical protein